MNISKYQADETIACIFAIFRFHHTIGRDIFNENFIAKEDREKLVSAIFSGEAAYKCRITICDRYHRAPNFDIWISSLEYGVELSSEYKFSGYWIDAHFDFRRYVKMNIRTPYVLPQWVNDRWNELVAETILERL